MENFNKVYITTSNLRKTLGATDVDEVVLSEKIIYDAILNRHLYLSEDDWNTLKKMYVFLESPEVFIKEYFKGWKDTFTYLIEEPPAYHANKGCKYLLSDFYNITIPSKIKKNKEWVFQARLWAYQNRSKLHPAQIEIFKEGFIQYFSKKVALSKNDLNTIDLSNSGSESIDNNVESVKMKIENLLKKISSIDGMDFYEKEFKEKKYWYNGEYEKCGYYIEHSIFSNLNYIRNSCIKPLIRNLYSYIALQANPNNEYEKNILDFLNFRPCDGCNKIK